MSRSRIILLLVAGVVLIGTVVFWFSRTGVPNISCVPVDLANASSATSRFAITNHSGRAIQFAVGRLSGAQMTGNDPFTALVSGCASGELAPGSGVQVSVAPSGGGASWKLVVYGQWYGPLDRAELKAKMKGWPLPSRRLFSSKWHLIATIQEIRS